MNKKSLLISEKSHLKIKMMATLRKQKIVDLTEEIIEKEFNKDPQCKNSTNI